MSEYIFRFPADTPELTWEGLTGATDQAWALRGYRSLEIGTTVKVRYWAPRPDAPHCFVIRLYDTDIARVYCDLVEFPAEDDGHQASREWLTRIVQDNGLGGNLWRIRRRKADGPG